MNETVPLFKGPPTKERVAAAIGLPASAALEADASVLVSDQIGETVRVKLDWVLSHVVGDADRRRQRFVTAIVPTIQGDAAPRERSRQVYDADLRRPLLEYKRTYFARLDVAGAGPTTPTRFMVPTSQRGPAPDPSRPWLFNTIIPFGDRDAFEEEKRKAGAPVGKRRRNPDNLAYMGLREPGERDRAARRLPEARPHRRHSTADAASPSMGAPLLAFLGLLAVVGVAGQARSAA